MNGRKNNLTNSSKFFFPLTVTKQEPKNNKDCRQKPRALCFREQRCHDSVFFCQRSVTANAKGPGPPRYKGQNQWSFGKTDGKPLADQWAGWRGEEPGGGGPAERHHIICVTTSSSRRHHHVPSSVWWATKKPPESQRDGAKKYNGTDQNNHAHTSLLLMSVHKRESRDTGVTGSSFFTHRLQTVKWNCYSLGSIHSQPLKFAF